MEIFRKEPAQAGDVFMILWNQKPYHSFDYMLKKRFGEKVYKLALDIGATCPNRDGTIGNRGCIFCSAGGSGDFAGDRMLSVTDQIERQKEQILQKRPVHKFISYFQAYTSTYLPFSRFQAQLEEAVRHPDIAAVSIGTRPDCLGISPAKSGGSERILCDPGILDFLSRMNQIKPVWVELGLQTIHESTASYIRRGYPLRCFDAAVSELQKRGLETIVHLILGLPGESPDDVFQTISYINSSHIQGVKLQLLHVLKGTDLARDYEDGQFSVLSQEEYLDLLIGCIARLDPEIVIHRVTGDGPKDLLIAPLWSSAKRTVLNELHRQMKLRGVWQGRDYTP